MMCYQSDSVVGRTLWEDAVSDPKYHIIKLVYCLQSERKTKQNTHFQLSEKC